MTTELLPVLVFKTDIRTPYDVFCMKGALDAHREIQQWNVDLDDVDCVLRIVSASLAPGDIIPVIHQQGFA